MNKAYVEIALSLSKRNWALSNNWQEAVLSDAFRHKDRESIVSDLQDWIQIANDNRDYLLVDPVEKEKLRTNFVASIKRIIQKIRQTQNQIVADSEIDQGRLNAFRIAGSQIFNNSETEFPLNLFKEIKPDTEISDDDSHEIYIADYSKERVALGVDTNRAVNEDSFLANIISENVKLNVLRALIRYSPSTSYEYSDIDNILADILKMSEGRVCPILFVGSQTLIAALHRSPYERDLADRHNIARHDGFSDEYICHIGQCEVYPLRFSDVDYCLLTSKDLFSELSFRRINDGQYVEVDFVLNKDSDTVGKLQFQYWMKVDLTKGVDCIKMDLDVKKEDFL